MTEVERKHFVNIEDGNAGRCRLIGPMTEGEAEALRERLEAILADRPFLDKRVYVDTAVPETEEEVTREWLEMEADRGEHDSEGLEFADPTGVSALRAAGPDNPRNLPCPTCGGANRLTPKDVALGYQCDPCADRLERGDY